MYNHTPFNLWLIAVSLLVLLLAIGSPTAAMATSVAVDTPPPVRHAPDWAAPHQTRQLLVKFPEASGASAELQLAKAGARIVRTIPELGLAVVETRADDDLATAAAGLVDHAAAEWVEPNYTFDLDLIPDDPYYVANQAPYLTRLGMSAAWDITMGRPEVVVAVLDTGVDTTHPDLQGIFWTNQNEIPDNGIDDDGNGFVDDVAGWNFPDNSNLIYDDHGHGTHVTGIVAAHTNNSIGIAGMASGVTVMPVDVFGGGIGTYADLIQAIVYATDNGADVINMSLGASSYSRGEEMAVDYAWSKGVVVVVAAGNTGSNTFHYPAAHQNSIAVAATTASDTLASFSTRGDFIDVAAPGYSVWSTYRNGGYVAMYGTSMASPHVAGLAALILSLNPHLNPDEVRALIEDNVDDLGDPGWDPSFGHGRINAARTLAEVTPDADPWPDKELGPPLDVWPDNCKELIVDGGFEGDASGWQLSGDAAIDASYPYTGTLAAHFPGGPSSHGVMTHTLTLSSNATEGTLWFVYRIYTRDFGWGSEPELPYDDLLTAEFRTDDGQLIQSLLRTGNSADNSGDGLPWDFYLYRLQAADLAPLTSADTVNLVFSAADDGDDLPTDFWLDDVRFCVNGGYRWYYPLWRR